MEANRTHIVAVEDDKAILRLLELVLSGDGHKVTCCTRGEEGREKALDPTVDLVLLDVNLPDMDGFEIARYIRKHSQVPIVMLTTRVDTDSTVTGLDAGADVYLTKPFNPEELQAQLRSVLRRNNMGSMPASGPEALEVSGWKLDAANTELIAPDETRIKLTEREFMILTLLMQQAGNVVTRDALQRQAAGREWNAEDRSLDVHVSRIRKKMEDTGAEVVPIRTVRGKGFTFQTL